MAGKKKETKKEKEIFFVGVKEPLEIRRNILEASREMVLLLQMYEKFKTVREEKRRAMESLRQQVRDIAVMVSRLKRHLPKTNLRAVPLEEIEKPVHKKEPVLEKVVEIKREEKALAHELTEIEKLEAELASIEQKLNTLA
ncbi:hypothetical protein HY639_01565 [Candidatus Woesearchaeota archaeon]|nr:hypothetical protein [Candidatus Woesearchaeota archaeon]